MSKIQKTWIEYCLILSFLAFMVIVTYAFSATAAVEAKDLEGYEVDFDSPGHEKEIEIVYQYRLSNSKLDKELLRREYIGVDLYDIDNDGKKEIIYMIYSTSDVGYCSDRGCSFNILKQSDKIDHQGNPIYVPIRWSSNKNDISGLVIKEIKILKTVTLGVYDLLLNGYIIWKWQGNYYDRYKSLDELQD